MKEQALRDEAELYLKRLHAISDWAKEASLTDEQRDELRYLVTRGRPRGKCKCGSYWAYLNSDREWYCADCGFKQSEATCVVCGFPASRVVKDTDEWICTICENENYEYCGHCADPKRKEDEDAS